jgi:bisphosphoglycerate-dependent phosphoglycerate mutase
MLKGTVSILDETAGGVSSDANVDEAYERVQSFHGASVRDRLRQNQTGLIIVGHNVMRAYIKHIERIDTVAALAVDLSIPSIRTYDLSPAGRLITRDITQIPKRG